MKIWKCKNVKHLKIRNVKTNAIPQTKIGIPFMQDVENLE